MKRIIVTCAAIIMLASVYCPAVEKKERSSVPPPPVRKVDTSASAKKIVPPATTTKRVDTTRKLAPVKPGPVKYDDFIDKNHNGIDDRKENLVKKDSAKSAK